MRKKALRAAFPYTLPICVGFLVLGMSYGFMMRSKGFSFVYPLFMSMFIFAGSMEFVTANLLLSAYNPVYGFFLALMVNARHLFYGISMLDKYKNTGWKKPYLIYGKKHSSEYRQWYDPVHGTGADYLSLRLFHFVSNNNYSHAVSLSCLACSDGRLLITSLRQDIIYHKGW